MTNRVSTATREDAEPLGDDQTPRDVTHVCGERYDSDVPIDGDGISRASRRWLRLL